MLDFAQFQGVGGFIFQLLMIMIILGVFGIIGYLAFYAKSFKIPCVIDEYVEGNIVRTFDYARVEKDLLSKKQDGLKFWKMKNKQVQAPHPGDYIYTSKGKSLHFVLVDDFLKIIKPAKIKYGDGEFTADEDDYHHTEADVVWHLNKNRQLNDRISSSGFWERYGHIMLGGAMMIIFIFGAWWLTSTWQDGSVELARAFTTGVRDLASANGGAPPG